MLDITVGHYRLAEKLGEGGMGEVYLARDQHLGRDVAVKLLPTDRLHRSSTVDRFINEARAASALNHPNIVTIHDAGEAEAGRFIVMEFVQGETLRAFIGRQLPVETIVDLARQLAKALGTAHEANIVHRDIKPENIMVRFDGIVKVLDFGLARWEAATAEMSTIKRNTHTGALLGTFRYMSPEQVRGEKVQSASDIFSVGVLLYELVTGNHPFEGRSQYDVLTAICSKSPVPPCRINSKVTPDLENLILWMMEKDAVDRPHAPEIIKELEELVSPAAIREPARLRKRRLMVGRQQELAALRAAFDRAAQGNGLLMSIGGEAGLGKTTLIEDFLDELKASRRPCAIGRGRCSERLAGTEAYLPFLEALEDLLASDEDRALTERIKRFAPKWYVQVTSISTVDSGPILAPEWASPEHLKRELAAFLERASGVRPLVLFFDDLHWADASSLDLITYVAAKFNSMSVLVLATYRPGELLLHKRPFGSVKLDLQARRLCRDLELNFLSPIDIQNYLELEFPRHHFPSAFAELIHSKTEGNPFFMAEMLRYLRTERVISEEQGHWVLAKSTSNLERDLPESILGMIKQKIDRLDDLDRRILSAASIQGYEFESAVVAKTLLLDAADVEERLDTLERMHSFIRHVHEQEFPDSTLTLRYRFVHVLYQNFLYNSVHLTRKKQWSAAVAEALLGFYQERSIDISAELAVLFETAREFDKAAGHFLNAARNARKVFAYEEAALSARRGLRVLSKLPRSSDRVNRELQLQLMLGSSLLATKGYGNDEVLESYDRAHDLAVGLGGNPPFLALWGLAIFYVARMELKRAREIGEQLLRLAQSAQRPEMLLVAHLSLGAAKYFSGEFPSALEHFEHHRVLDDPQQRVEMTVRYSLEPGLLMRAFAARTLWFIGYPDRALAELKETLKAARLLGEPQTLAFLISMTALAHQMRGEVEASRMMSMELKDHSIQHGLNLWLAEGGFLLGWAETQDGNVEDGMEQMSLCLSEYRATGTRYPYFEAQLAEVYGINRRVQEGFSMLHQAAHFSFPTYWDADLKRVEGDLFFMDSQIVQAEATLQEALELARNQGARSLELRSAISLSKVWRHQGRIEEARRLLSSAFSWFTEGFETADLKRAQTQLQQLS
jgi:predicted ATPase